MKDIRNQILNARETRSNKITQKLSNNLPIVVVKLNICGNDKNSNLYNKILNYFYNKIKLNKINNEFINSIDGNYYIFNIDENDLINTKKYLVEIENEPLGRLIDIDLYKQDNIQIKRNDISQTRRKCIICNSELNKCVKEKKHTVQEVKKTFNEIIKNDLIKIISNEIKISLKKEIDCEYKLGLVTKTTKGSHPDMDYLLFYKCIDNLNFENYLKEGFNINKDSFNNLRKHGINLENEMYKITDGINTYKGLIFLLGLYLPSYINYLITKEDIKNNIKYLAKDIYKDFNKLDDTFGKKAYKLHNIKGVREIGHTGLEVMFNNKIINDTDNEIRKSLINFMHIIDDTTLIKRGNIDSLKYAKDIAKEIIKKNYNINIIKKYTEEFINKNLTIGGCADLTIINILNYRLNKLFEIN